MPQILVNHGTISASASKIQTVGGNLNSDAAKIQKACNSLSGKWTGTGKSTFTAASKSLTTFMKAGAEVVSAESKSLRTANSNFEDQDAQIATNITKTGE